MTIGQLLPRRSPVAFGVLLALLSLVVPGAAAQEKKGTGTVPDATMLQYPDVGRERIVFVYANDVWTVDRAGGVAVPLASPDGP